MNHSFLDISEYLIERFGAKLRRDNWRFDCPFCSDDKSHFGVSLEKERTHCFKCEYKSGIIKFICDVEGVNYTGAVKILRKYGRRRSIKRSQTLRKGSRFNAEILPRYTPLLDLCDSSRGARIAQRYLLKRGFFDEDILQYQLGLSTEDKLAGRIIIPFFERGQFIYYVARSFMGASPKYINPNEKKLGIGKAEILFNIDTAREAEEIYICEGVFDAIAVGTFAVAILGKSLSDDQAYKLISTGCKSVTVMLDSDAKSEAFQIGAKLQSFVNVKVALIKKGDPASNRTSLGEVEKVCYDLPAHVESRIGKFKRSS